MLTRFDLKIEAAGRTDWPVPRDGGAPLPAQCEPVVFDHVLGYYPADDDAGEAAGLDAVVIRLHCASDDQCELKVGEDHGGTLRSPTQALPISIGDWYTVSVRVTARSIELGGSYRVELTRYGATSLDLDAGAAVTRALASKVFSTTFRQDYGLVGICTYTVPTVSLLLDNLHVEYAR